MQSVRFVAVGELLVDVVAEGSGHDARIGVAPGGSAFNAAVAAAALGADATVIGAVGDDPAGRMIISELETRGVRAEATIRQGSTGVFLLAGGEIRVDRGVSRELDLPATIDADVVLVSGYLTTETITATLARAQAPWVALDAAQLDELPSGGNAVLASDGEARRLTGADAEAAARALGERYRLACVTRGARGAAAVLDGKFETAAPPDAIAADPPGAGDAFAAALLVTLARGAEVAEALAEACRWGARAAAISSRA
jgi:sugar/nucleoside kinase (ribokinase family)